MPNAVLRHHLALAVLCSLAVLYTSAGSPSHGQTKNALNKSQKAKAIVYTNLQYHFRLYLPQTWNGYGTSLCEWQGDDGKTYQPGESMPPPIKGPLIIFRHPLSTIENPRQDFEIMVFTKAQWRLVEEDKIILSAGPAGPYELGRNVKYVFALPPRFNGAGIDGWRDVNEIIKSHPLHPF